MTGQADMENLKLDLLNMRRLIHDAQRQTDFLLAYTDGAEMSEACLQQTLERTAHHFEQACLDMRVLCERYSPGAGSYPRPRLDSVKEVAGHVEMLYDRWLQITLNTLLPHCRYQPPLWLTDSILRLLDEYETAGRKLLLYPRALLVIEEFCGIGGRRIFDQDNKGWKAVSNAFKGRLVPDDDQHSLNVALLSTLSDRNICRITLLPQEDTAMFFLERKEGQQIAP